MNRVRIVRETVWGDKRVIECQSWQQALDHVEFFIEVVNPLRDALNEAVEELEEALP